MGHFLSDLLTIHMYSLNHLNQNITGSSSWTCLLTGDPDLDTLVTIAVEAVSAGRSPACASSRPLIKYGWRWVMYSFHHSAQIHR